MKCEHGVYNFAHRQLAGLFRIIRYPDRSMYSLALKDNAGTPGQAINWSRSYRPYHRLLALGLIEDVSTDDQRGYRLRITRQGMEHVIRCVKANG